MKVLSLFDGISCGRLALARAGIPVEKYYASEIDKYAIQIAQKNYPDTIQIGDCTQVDFAKFRGEIDLVIGGSPCQGFSFAGKQLNFNDHRSKLFFEFVRAIREIQPKYFLLENVKMKQEFQDVISEHLGVQPIEINSALVSAQNRKRLYWTNIPNVGQPADKGILLKDIVHEYHGDIIDIEKYCLSEKNLVCCSRKFGSKAPDITGKDKSNTITAAMGTGGGNIPFMFHELEKYIVPFDKTLVILEKEIQRGKIGYFRCDSQANRVYDIHGKAVCLCGDAGGGAAKMGQYLFGCLTPDRVEKRQNGQRFNLGDKFYTLTAQDVHGILLLGYIRKLTPIECERLQTLTSVKNKYIIHICLDNQKNYVSAENQNPKSPSVVGSVENDRKKESVSCVEQNSNVNNLLLNDVALPNVQVSIGENQLVIRYQNTVLLNASFAEILNKFPHLKAIENFARTFVLINIIVAQITKNGKVESQQKEINLTQAQNGNIVVELCGNEIMPLVKYATKDINTIQNLLNATILYPLSIRNIEQTLKTLFYYVANVICSFIPEEIQKNCILNIQTDLGYTFGISNSARYKALGNGWTVDVIAHIFGGLKNQTNHYFQSAK